jgi:DNA polymerase-3 subunit gamma/tau
MQLSQLISAQDLQLYYQVACKGRADLQLAVTQEQGFEMCVLRLLAFRPLQPNEVLVSAPQQLQQQAAQVAVQALVQNAQPYVEEYQEPAAPVVEIQSVVSAQIHEPSSDDFLDEPMLDVTEPNSTANSDQIVFDPASEDVLFDLDESNDDVNLVADNADQVEASSDDFLFDEIAPLNDVVEAETAKPQDNIAVAVQEEDLFLSQEQMPIESVSEVAAAKIVNEPILEFEQPSLEEKRVAVETVSAQNSGLMPQDILRLTPQQLEGDWTVDKWEYWFRNSTLTPAVQELAQQGVMTGQIDGESLFHIPPKYEQLLTQLQHTLEQALKNEWPNTHFQVKYAEVETTTPYSMQNQRKEKAYARASELLHAETAVKDILQNFDGEIQNIQLK